MYAVARVSKPPTKAVPPWHNSTSNAVSEMVNAGVDLYTVGRVLGHRDSRSTQRYSHLTAETLAAAVSSIGPRKRA